MTKVSFSLLVLLNLLFGGNPAIAQRTHGGFYTQEKLSNLRNNCDKYEWGKKLRSNAISKAAFWISKSNEELWGMVQGQNLPRAIDVTFDRVTTGPKILGCLKCGLDVLQFGNYPYEPEFEKRPWKLTCPPVKVCFQQTISPNSLKAQSTRAVSLMPQRAIRPCSSMLSTPIRKILFTSLG